MGQIIGGAAKPKRCNLNKLSQLGTPAAGEHILVSSDNSMNAAGQGNFDCYIMGDGTTAAAALPLRTIGSDTIGFNGKNEATSGAVFDFGTLQDQIAYAKAEGLVVNGAGKILGGLSATYWISYVVVQEDTTIGLEFTRNESYQYDGKIFILDDVSLLVANTMVVPLYQVALNETYSNAYTLTAGQCLCVEARANDVCAFTQIKTLKQKVAEIENVVTSNQALLKKYPLEGVNLVRLDAILPNTLLYSTGDWIANNAGWRGIEIELCSDEVPLYFNIFYQGYYAFFDKDGNVLKIVMAAAGTRDLYSGYKIPKGAVRGRFCINANVSDTDIENYAYISYGRPLMQDEINNRVSYEGSYTMFDFLQRPTDYDGGDVSAFADILCIGDSITKGYFNATPISGQTFVANPIYSYPSNLARITGCNVVNLGDSGESSYSWWSAHQNDAELTGRTCAIIEFGINDAADTLDTATKDAFDNIISALKTRNPQIKIFISGIINGKSYMASLESDAYYAKDQWLKNYYNTYYASDEQVFFLDIARYGHIRNKYSDDSKKDDYNMGHLSAYGYWRLAKDYANYISYIMRQSNNTFKGIQFIGTDFTY